MPLDTRIPLMAQPIQMPDFNALAMQKQEMARNAMAMQMQQAQLAQAQRQEQAQQSALARRQQAGALAAKGDFAGAQNTALEGGDTELYSAIHSLSVEQRKEALERNRTLAAVALSVAELPYEQRAQAIQGAAPYLAQVGIDPEQVGQFDPTDENIAGIVATTQSIGDILEQKNKDRAFGLDHDKFEYGKTNDEANRAITRRGQDISAATARRGQDISASTTRRGQDLTNARTQAGPVGTKQQQGLARQKLTSLRAIEQQVGRVEAAMATMEKKGYSGAFMGHIPGAVDPSSNSFDKAVAGLSPLIRQLTRVPGEGSMSDYEGKLAQMTLPSRVDTAEGRREALGNIKELIKNTRTGYQEFLGQDPSQPANVVRYDAKGNRVK